MIGDSLSQSFKQPVNKISNLYPRPLQNVRIVWNKESHLKVSFDMASPHIYLETGRISTAMNKTLKLKQNFIQNSDDFHQFSAIFKFCVYVFCACAVAQGRSSYDCLQVRGNENKIIFLFIGFSSNELCLIAFHNLIIKGCCSLMSFYTFWYDCGVQWL